MYSMPIGQSLHPGLYLEASNAETLLGTVAENPFYRSPLTLYDCFFRHPLFDIKLGIKRFCNSMSTLHLYFVATDSLALFLQRLEFECVVVESCLFSETSASRV